MPNKKQREKLLENGRCTSCGKNKVSDKTTCRSCQDYSNDYRKQKRRQRSKSNLCITCGKKPPRHERKTCQGCRDKEARIYVSWYRNNTDGKKLYRELNKTQSSKLRQDRKRRVIDHYGGECLCCGESCLLLLTIDHINEDGSEHRRQIAPNFKGRSPGGDHFYRWLETNDLPDGFQTLCYNCNIGKHRNGGVCPHVNIENGV